MILVVVLSYVCSVVPAAAYDMRESSSSSAGRGSFSANCRWWERSSGTVSHYPLRRPSAQTVTPEIQAQLAAVKLLIVDELGLCTALADRRGASVWNIQPASRTWLVDLPFDEWTSVFGSERLTGALLDRLTHHVHILEMNGESFRLATSKKAQRRTGQATNATPKHFCSAVDTRPFKPKISAKVLTLTTLVDRNSALSTYSIVH
jgi:IstB-like ATP binding protein